MHRSLLFLVAVCLLLGCQSPSSSNNQDQNEPKRGPIDLQGHRGWRGGFPENSLQAFVAAARMQVTTLELDVVVTADGKLLVSHEAWFNRMICEDQNQELIAEENERELNIYKMTYAETQQCSCGVYAHPNFPMQQKKPHTKPLLSEVLETIEGMTDEIGYLPLYNIELKTEPDGVGTWNPAPENFAKSMVDMISEKGILDRTTLQSFDFDVLRALQPLQADKSFKIAVLIDGDPAEQHNWQDHLDELGFRPDIYSCWFKLLDSADVQLLQDEGYQVIPWTVNEKEDMRRLTNWGVDGLITDYPDVAAMVMREMEVEVIRKPL